MILLSGIGTFFFPSPPPPKALNPSFGSAVLEGGKRRQKATIGSELAGHDGCTGTTWAWRSIPTCRLCFSNNQMETIDNQKEAIQATKPANFRTQLTEANYHPELT